MSQLQAPAASRFDAQVRSTFEAVAAAIKKHGGRIRKIPGVLGIRPGYRFKDGWITDQPAVVVTVRRKRPLAEVPKGERIPRTLGGVPVDVAPATPAEQLRADQAADTGARGVEAAPAPPTPDEELALPGWELLGPAPAPEPEARGVTQDYVPPPKAKLDEVKGAMTLTCHASPDAGWPTLKPFLAGVTKSLTIGMYDFSAPHVARGLQAGMKKASGPLRMIVDPALSLNKGKTGKGIKAGDLTEVEIRDDLAKALPDRFSFEWAAVRRVGKVSGGIFPTAYHIKVAVRDSKSMWLSSGNWQTTNQPDVDPLSPRGTADGDILRTYNREWHVIVDHPGLSKLFETFLRWDMSQAAPLQAGPAPTERPDLLVPAEEEEVSRAPAKFFAPAVFKFTASKPVRIQPLLTPDNYAERVAELIGSAKRTLYFQNQYIQINKVISPRFRALIDALLGRVKAGLDVRILLRDGGDSREMLETLQAQGFRPEQIRLQKGLHNKGIVVDSAVVALGSHNWSSDGTTANRDATLIIHDPDVAKYYEQIYLFDWDYLARKRATAEQSMPQVARGVEAVPGMTRVAWTD